MLPPEVTIKFHDEPLMIYLARDEEGTWLLSAGCVEHLPLLSEAVEESTDIFPPADNLAHVRLRRAQYIAALRQLVLVLS